MAILAMDSSTNTASIAVLENDRVLHESFLNAGLTHSQTLMPMVQNAFEMIKDIQIEKIAVTVGPGSFTGVRIAVAAAKGLAFSKDIPCVAISSLEALAYNCRNIKGEYTICSMLDARLNRVYCALFSISNGEIVRLSDDECAEIVQLEEKLSKIENNIIILGDGVKVFIKAFPEYENCVFTENIYIKGSSVAFASENKTAINSSELNPVYLQMPQAERERLERLKKSEDLK